jgi:hypothetical protein
MREQNSPMSKRETKGHAGRSRSQNARALHDRLASSIKESLPGGALLLSARGLGSPKLVSGVRERRSAQRPDARQLQSGFALPNAT